jgi:hypothetical protein
MAVVIIEGAMNLNDPASGVIPLDAAFPKRVEVMLHLWLLLQASHGCFHAIVSPESSAGELF